MQRIAIVIHQLSVIKFAINYHEIVCTTGIILKQFDLSPNYSWPRVLGGSLGMVHPCQQSGNVHRFDDTRAEFSNLCTKVFHFVWTLLVGDLEFNRQLRWRTWLLYFSAWRVWWSRMTRLKPINGGMEYASVLLKRSISGMYLCYYQLSSPSSFRSG